MKRFGIGAGIFGGLSYGASSCFYGGKEKVIKEVNEAKQGKFPDNINEGMYAHELALRYALYLESQGFKNLRECLIAVLVASGMGFTGCLGSTILKSLQPSLLSATSGLLCNSVKLGACATSGYAVFKFAESMQGHLSAEQIFSIDRENKISSHLRQT